MSIERKEPTLSNPDATLNKKRSGEPGAAKRAAGSKPQVIVQKQSSGLLWMALLLALGAFVAGGYAVWQLLLSQQTLAEQQVRINDLEQRLALSDDESTQSLTSLTANVRELKKQVELALSEVDKLWGTRNVNRKAIADNKKQLEGKAELDGVNESLAAIETKLNKPIQTVRQRSSEQELLLQSLRERLVEQQQGLDSLSNKITDYAAKDDLNQLQQQVDAHSEAVKSFDKFRVSVNRDLLTLKQRTGAAAPSR